MWRKIKWLWLLAESLLPGRLRIFLMRRRGAVIGRGVSLGRLSLFECGRIILGDRCRIAAFTRFKVRGTLELGEGTKVEFFTRITGAEIRVGPENLICKSVTIAGSGKRAVFTSGPRCYIGDRCLVNLSCPVTLGEEVGIGGSTLIFTHGSWQSELDGFPIASGEVRAGDFSWLGANVTIFAGVTIGEFATVGGGTVLRRRVPPYSLAMGNPGKVVLTNGAHLKHLAEEERFSLCAGIVDELAEHQEWMGHAVEKESSPEHRRVTIDGSGLLFRRHVERVEPAAAVIAFERMSDELILEWEAAGGDWFDLSRRRCSRPVTGLSAMVRSAFSNHGVRFQTTAKGSIAGAPDAKRGIKPASSSTQGGT